MTNTPIILEISMAGYSKLDCGIVDSSLWEMPHEYLRVWIAMLAKCDASGCVRVAAPAMARLCHLDRPALDAVIDTFCAPDPESRTPDNEGRRLQRVDGGWQILNYAKYREGLKQPDLSTDRTRRFREKQRERSGTVGNGTKRSGTPKQRHSAKADAEAKAEAVIPPQSPPQGGESEKSVDPFAQFWQAYPRRLSKGQAIKAWEQVDGKKHLAAILASIEQHKRSPLWLKDGGTFIQYPATWLRARGWENDLSDESTRGGKTQKELDMKAQLQRDIQLLMGDCEG
jgi:hypothetical protein